MLNRNHMEEKASARFISIGQRIKSEIKLNKSPFPLNTRQEGEEGLCNRALLKTNHRLLLSTLVTAPCTFKGTGIYSRESTKINLYLYFFFFTFLWSSTEKSIEVLMNLSLAKFIARHVCVQARCVYYRAHIQARCVYCRAHVEVRCVYCRAHVQARCVYCRAHVLARCARTHMHIHM